MQPDIAAIGAALYGRHWQSDLAEALGVTPRTVRRWTAGQPVPPGARAEIAALARSRSADLAALADDLTAH